MFCPDGHINLNRNFIKVLQNSKYVVDFVFKDSYKDNFEITFPNRVLLEIPKSYMDNNLGKIGSRYFQLKIYGLIKKNVNLSEYSKIFFSSYEEVSFFFAKIKGNVFVLNHANVSNFNNPIKSFFLYRISKSVNHVVLHDYLKVFLNSKGIKNVSVEYIGFSPPIFNKIFFGRDYLVGQQFKRRIFVPQISK